MKKHRLARLCSILLLAALLVSLTVPLASAYSDVTRSAFPDYFDAINYVTDNGLMNGTSSTQFEPNSFVSRAMVVTTLYRMAGSPSSSASVSFTDVSSTDWFYKAVRWSVVWFIPQLWALLPAPGFWLLLAGGLCYSIGCIFYVLKKVPYMHSIFHVWILAGSVCQFLSICLFVL